jgi:hypothetical protein
MFTTLLSSVGATVPSDQVIDGKDHGTFFRGETSSSARDAVMPAYAINATTGALTLVYGSPFVAGSHPDGVIVDPKVA